MSWGKVRENIWRMSQLKEGWDSYGGKPASPAHVSDAMTKSESMEGLGFPVPHVTLCSDGSFAFEWTNRDSVDITIYSEED